LKTCASFVHKQEKNEFTCFSSFSVHRKLAGNTENQKQNFCFQFKVQVQLSTEQSLFY